MSRAYSTLVTRLMFLSFLAVLVCAAPALAGTVTWYLSDVDLSGGGTAIGSFMVNTSTLAVTNVDITVSGAAVTAAGGVSPFTFQGASVGTALLGGGSDVYIASTAVSGPEYELVMYYSPPKTVLAYSTNSPVDILQTYDDSNIHSNLEVVPSAGTYNQIYFLPASTGFTGPQFTTTTPAPAPVPLPPSALLLGTGLIPLAWASRKKLWRK